MALPLRVSCSGPTTAGGVPVQLVTGSWSMCLRPKELASQAFWAISLHVNDGDAWISSVLPRPGSKQSHIFFLFLGALMGCIQSGDAKRENKSISTNAIDKQQAKEQNKKYEEGPSCEKQLANRDTYRRKRSTEQERQALRWLLREYGLII